MSWVIIQARRRPEEARLEVVVGRAIPLFRSAIVLLVLPKGGAAGANNRPDRAAFEGRDNMTG